MWDSISSVRGLVRSSVRMLQRKKRSLLGRSRDWQLHAPSLCIGSLRHVSSYTLVDATGGAQSTVQGVQTSTARGLPTMPTKATCVDLPSNPAYHVAPLSGMFDGAAIHPQAIVSEEASIGQGVRVGPFCVVGPEVTLEAGVELQSHVVVSGRTIVGADSTIYPFASIGAKPQDLKYKGEVSELRIGQRCKVFEYSHLSGGTAGGGGVTQIGDDCLLMSHVHVGHDCNVGNRVVVASNAALAGHVQARALLKCSRIDLYVASLVRLDARGERFVVRGMPSDATRLSQVGDGAQISGYACVHQRVCVGSGAFLAAASVLVADLIPFGLAVGNRATLETINMRGVRRQRAPQAEQVRQRASASLARMSCVALESVTRQSCCVRGRRRTRSLIRPSPGAARGRGPTSSKIRRARREGARGKGFRSAASQAATSRSARGWPGDAARGRVTRRGCDLPCGCAHGASAGWLSRARCTRAAREVRGACEW
eukprot:6177897-Pleurochrysis_carterae.AAC.8